MFLEISSIKTLLKDLLSQNEGEVEMAQTHDSSDEFHEDPPPSDR